MQSWYPLRLHQINGRPVRARFTGQWWVAEYGHSYKTFSP